MINKGRLTNLFIDLARIDSPSGYENEIASFVNGKLDELGAKHQSDKFGNVIAFVKGSGKPLFMSAHLDTVEPGRGIKPVIEKKVFKSSGKTILGADNKAAVAGLIEALWVIKESGGHSRSLEVVFTRSEEVANLGAVNLDYSSLSAKEGYIFDSSNPIGTIILASPFYNRFDVEILGKAAHASQPGEAINALTVLNLALNQIKLGKISQNTLVNIGVVRGGDVRNTIPGEIKLEGEVRSYLENELESASTDIKNSFSSAAKKLGVKARTKFVRENPGYKHSQNDGFVKRTEKILKDIGFKPSFQMSWGCSDANIFSQHGINVLNLGDGTTGSHTVEERMALEDLVSLTRLILEFMKSKRKR